MKKKITISLDENILKKIDKGVKKGEGKNRSAVIETILQERYGAFVDTSVIIFGHDYKWDNRDYPFDTPKALLKIKEKTVLTGLVEIFSQPGLVDYYITIPEGTLSLFENEKKMFFNHLNITFIELDPEYKTGNALQKIMTSYDLYDDIIIANGDIFYGNLNLEEYYSYHREQKGDFSFCLKFVMNPEQLGNVAINGNKILDFVDRPKANATYLTNSGLYITTKKFLKKHDFGNYLEHDFFPKLPSIANIIGYIYQGQWEHIQNDSAFERVNGQLM